jgi:hypothetical protein
MTAAAATRANALPILFAPSMMMSLAMGMRQCLGPWAGRAAATHCAAAHVLA